MPLIRADGKWRNEKLIVSGCQMKQFIWFTPPLRWIKPTRESSQSAWGWFTRKTKTTAFVLNLWFVCVNKPTGNFHSDLFGAQYDLLTTALSHKMIISYINCWLRAFNISSLPHGLAPLLLFLTLSKQVEPGLLLRFVHLGRNEDLSRVRALFKYQMD